MWLDIHALISDQLYLEKRLATSKVNNAILVIRHFEGHFHFSHILSVNVWFLTNWYWVVWSKPQLGTRSRGIQSIIEAINQIANSMGPRLAHLGPVSPRIAPCWPHKPCYQGTWQINICCRFWLCTLVSCEIINFIYTMSGSVESVCILSTFFVYTNFYCMVIVT